MICLLLFFWTGWKINHNQHVDRTEACFFSFPHSYGWHVDGVQCDVYQCDVPLILTRYRCRVLKVNAVLGCRGVFGTGRREALGVSPFQENNHRCGGVTITILMFSSNSVRFIPFTWKHLQPERHQGWDPAGEGKKTKESRWYEAHKGEKWGTKDGSLSSMSVHVRFQWNVMDFTPKRSSKALFPSKSDECELFSHTHTQQNVDFLWCSSYSPQSWDMGRRFRTNQSLNCTLISTLCWNHTW